MIETDTLISLRDLRKAFGKRLFKRGFLAIDGVSLEVGRGSIFGLLGPNGAGKTTLIKVLMGLVCNFEGEARLFGLPPGDPRARRLVGYLPEAHRLPPYLTGRQVLMLYGQLSGRTSSWLRERVGGLLDRVGMGKSADRKVREYSKGMQQRIGLAQALIHEPEMIFLDEPTDGVDPVGRKVIREIVSELKEKGVTVFINSHLLMEVEMICDRVVIMDKGKIIREGTVEALTPKTGIVRFELASLPADLEALLDGVGAFLHADEGGFELALDDDEVDGVIDRLRRGSVGIRGIEARKLTLEESFIDLVRRDANR